jgi:eukaryotic-like serine/threonine-protein kinase
MTPSLGSDGTRYAPIAQIGRGGMAEVVLAMMDAGSGLRRLAVLKRIWPELATDPEFVAMFGDEGRLSLRLNHPNVVRTYEVLVSEGELAIAMEYLDGQPLTRVLNRLRGQDELGLPLRLRILINVLAGLEHAHTLTDLDGTPLEVVHRDISPQNVFVTYDGQVKLVDFGVAKTLAASHHTRPGALKGKLAYMAPEQFQRATIDHRVDLFALGVMLWEMLAGRRMWHGKTEVEIVAHLASGQPLPPLPAECNLPAGLDTICARALAPDPDRRYQTAAELEMDLERMLIGSADSHARDLGKVVSLAFATERAERRTIIDRCLQGEAPGLQAIPPAPVDPEETPTRAVSPAVSIAVPPSVPPAAPLFDSADKSAWTSVIPRPARRPRRRLAMGALVAAVSATILLAGSGWRPIGGESRREPNAPAAGRQPTERSSVATTPSTAAPAHQAAAGGEGGEPNAPPHHHHHHHEPAVDEDATLPPSLVIDEP